MRLANETGLPMPIVKVAQAQVNSHPRMDDRIFSVTEVLKSVRQIVLARLHADEIEMDVQDTFSMWNGTAIHYLLQKAAEDVPGLISERRLEISFGGFRLSGEFDLLDTSTNTLYDYKTSKVSTIDKNRTLKEDKWLRQLYLYAEILEMLGYERPKRGCIVAMATDHSKVKAENQSGYPKHPIQMLTWDLDDGAFASKVSADALRNMKDADIYIRNPDEELPECTYSDCWCTEDWAIIKKGSTKAYKRFDTEEEARRFYETMDKDSYRIYHRVSDFMNCRLYCQCSRFCSQWQKMKDAEKICEDITDLEYVPF